MMKNNILKIFFLVFLLFPTITFANNCKYKSKLESCKSELFGFYKGDLSSVIPGTRLKSFGDFPCIQDSEERQYYQIAMDALFKEIDKEMDEYLQKLFDNKNYYFGKEKKTNFFDGINDIYKARDYFLAKYYIACEETYEEIIDCFGSSTIIKGASDFLNFGTGDCRSLAKTKTNIFLGVAYDGLLKNKKQILVDQKRFYDLPVKTKYEEVLDLFSINYSYIERLRKKWTVKIKNTLGS